MAQKTDEITQAQQAYDDLVQEVQRVTQAAKAKPKDTKLQQDLADARLKLSAADDWLISLRGWAARDGYASRIATAQGEADALQSDIADALLAAHEAPGDEALAERVEDLKRRRQNHLNAVHDLTLARDAAARRAQSQNLDSRTRQLKAMRAQHHASVEHAIKQSRDLLDFLAELGIKWKNAHTAAREAETNAREMLRYANEGRGSKRSMVTIEPRISNALSWGTVCALFASRLTRDGPSLSPMLELQGFGKQLLGTPDEMEASMRSAAERHLAMLSKVAPEMDLGTDPDSFFPGTPVSDDFYDLGDKPSKAKARA